MKLFSRKLVVDGDKTGEEGPRLDDDHEDSGRVEGGGKEGRETEEPCCVPVFHNLRHLMKVRIQLINRHMTCVHHDGIRVIHVSLRTAVLYLVTKGAI